MDVLKLPSVPSSPVSVTVTSALGWLLSLTVKLASVPVSLVVRLLPVMVSPAPAVSLSAAPVVGTPVKLSTKKTLVLLPSSLMVAVPEAAPLLVTVPVIVPVVNVKLSLVSNTLSLVIAVRSTTLVLFAPMLTPLTADTHELPS